MRRWVSGTVAAVAIGVAAMALVSAQTTPRPSTVRVPRTPEGKPDFSGIWQAMNTANWDIQGHSAKQGPVYRLGAAFSVPAGLGIVEGDEIPYKPEALKQKMENGKNWVKLDPEVKCFLPGTPRAMYMPYPFQIAQSPKHFYIAFEFADATRIAYLDPKDPNANLTGPDDWNPNWMGVSKGRWDGDTLVVDVEDFNDQTWFDRAGNYHSDQLKVTERYTLLDANTIQYEATITDPEVFMRPWKMSFPIYRRREKNAQLLDYRCVEFAEDAMYGELYKTPPKDDQ